MCLEFSNGHICLPKKKINVNILLILKKTLRNLNLQNKKVKDIKFPFKVNVHILL